MAKLPKSLITNLPRYSDFPAVMITSRWVHNGHLLEYSNKYEGHSLIVKGSTIFDAGQYYCEVIIILHEVVYH